MLALRHKFELTIFIILVFIAFCTSYYWIHWAFISFLAFMVLVVGIWFYSINTILDLLFMNESDFVFDPDYNHWKDLSEPKDFQFEADLSSVRDPKKIRWEPAQ